jgi:hypothetical protein
MTEIGFVPMGGTWIVSSTPIIAVACIVASALIRELIMLARFKVAFQLNREYSFTRCAVGAALGVRSLRRRPLTIWAREGGNP